MIISITGGNGFIGKAIAMRMHALGHEVRVLTRGNKKVENYGKYKIYYGDITRKTNVIFNFLSNTDLVIHCAAEITDEKKMKKTNVFGTKNILSLLKKSVQHSKKTVHWIQLSTCGVYRNNCKLITEKTIPKPANNYQKTKLEADNILKREANKKINYTIIRPSIVFERLTIPPAIKKVILLVKFRLFFYIDNCDAFCNFTHLDDLVSAVCLIIKNKKSYNKTYIISSGCYLNDLIISIARKLKIKEPKLRINMSLLLLGQNLFQLLNLKLPKIDFLINEGKFSSQKIKKELKFKFENEIPKSLIINQ